MRSLTKYAVYLLIFCALTVGSAYVTFQLAVEHISVEVPDLTGMDAASADEVLKGKGLYLKIKGEDYDTSVPRGRILSQDITGGSKVKGSAEVGVVLSKGPSVRLIPDTVGMVVDEARKEFVQKGLDVNVIEVHSETVEAGSVLAQRPGPEEWAGQGITLIASAGPYVGSYYSPSFMGLLKEDALGLARELGLNVELTVEGRGSLVVAGQKPSPGARILQNSTIYLQLKGD